MIPPLPLSLNPSKGSTSMKTSTASVEETSGRMSKTLPPDFRASGVLRRSGDSVFRCHQDLSFLSMSAAGNIGRVAKIHLRVRLSIIISSKCSIVKQQSCWPVQRGLIPHLGGYQYSILLSFGLNRCLIRDRFEVRDVCGKRTRAYLSISQKRF